MEEFNDQTIRDFLINAELPGTAHMLIWGELEKGSDAQEALTRVLFDVDAVADPAEAPCRNQADAAVRDGVIQCTFEYPEIRAAVVKLMIELARPPKPWWKFW